MMEEMLNRKGPTEDGEEGAEAAPSLMGLDRIEVLDVAVGDKYPILSNARVRPSGEDGGVVSLGAEPRLRHRLIFLVSHSESRSTSTSPTTSPSQSPHVYSATFLDHDSLSSPSPSASPSSVSPALSPSSYLHQLS